jgi:hypothetical protein
MSSKSAISDRKIQLVENEQQRHTIANVPMQIPQGSFQVVPGIFVAGRSALPRLIEFFDVTHVVRCLETEPQQQALDKREAEAHTKLQQQIKEKNKNKKKTDEEPKPPRSQMDMLDNEDVEEGESKDEVLIPDEVLKQQQQENNNKKSNNTTSTPPLNNNEDILITIGGTIAQPYGSSIPYPKNVFHCPIRDSIDEPEFLSWARKASEFIANTLRIEEEEEVAIAAAEAAKENNNQEENEPEETKKNANDDDGGDDDGSQKAKKTKKRSHYDAFSNGQQNQQQNQQHHVHGENCGCDHKNDDHEKEEEEKVDHWASFRERAPGTIVIHCEKGKSRSPAIAMAYLILKRGMTLQEAMEMFEHDGDDDNNNNERNGDDSSSSSSKYELQLNPIFVLELAKLEAEVHGSPIFDLDAYWVQRLQQLFPKVPTATIARELAAAGSNMLVAREKLMGVAARQFFDRDALMVDALHNIMVRTVEEFRVAKNMRIPESAKTVADVVTKDECAKMYSTCEKKRDVALMKLTQLLEERMTIS